MLLKFRDGKEKLITDGYKPHFEEALCRAQRKESREIDHSPMSEQDVAAYRALGNTVIEYASLDYKSKPKSIPTGVKKGSLKKAAKNWFESPDFEELCEHMGYSVEAFRESLELY